MYIAVILENYTQARDDVSNGITDEDYDMFYEVWAEFDPDSTMYMPYASVGELIDCLEPPLQIAKPNKFKVVHMDIPIVRFSNPKTGEVLQELVVHNIDILFPGEVKDDMVFCSDLLDALTQEFFSREGNAIEEPLHVEDIKVSSQPSHGSTFYILQRNPYLNT